MFQFVYLKAALSCENFLAILALMKSSSVPLIALLVRLHLTYEFGGVRTGMLVLIDVLWLSELSNVAKRNLDQIRVGAFLGCSGDRSKHSVRSE